MPIRFGPLELIILLVIVVLLFGPGRIGKVAGEIGKSIKSFREGIGGKEEENSQPSTTDETKK
ncbi:MAG: twin-arginine translocase TatA/TatE family subunit [Anaerolineales bacterium]|jgi:sec-independent protein translocase protein TatA|nr:twin-arginine translocase TatA/TatE family subunit [Chloroflexota bacterium]MBK6647709.1 twin-arginine translocase TatA/TatE family subunit [Anaerolineales bacterium]MCC6987127.1 twin-arginine translocase TatA/TatE family subunit [Anaerolineales bacterium]